jgi:predicted nucleotidyltransferase
MNEFRWSERLKTEDGLLMLSPGLGTKMVDRMSGNYPVLIAPGNPDIPFKQSLEEYVNQAPRIVDVINLKTNEFETVHVTALLEQFGCRIPRIRDIVSYRSDNALIRPDTDDTFCDVKNCLVTFQGLLEDGKTVSLVDTLLKTLQRKMQIPVQIEFASDGSDFYLLQCKPQVLLPKALTALVPEHISDNRLIFRAQKHLSGGCVRDLTHIVFISKKNFDEYCKNSGTGSIISALNRLNVNLPRKSTLLILPGITEKSGDEKHYIDFDQFSNAAMICEYYPGRLQYKPEYSLGTIYFQDLIKSSVRYLPIFLDDDKTRLNNTLLNTMHNLLESFVPGSAEISDVIKVIDIQKEFHKEKLHVIMTSSSDHIAAFIQPHDLLRQHDHSSFESGRIREIEHWRWRSRMAEKIAAAIDGSYFGIKAVYIFGSAKNATSGPKSDIDLLVHIDKDTFKKDAFYSWIDGWDKSISHTNYLKTGFVTESLLDMHYITDEDIEKQTSYAVKITARSDAARQLPMKNTL